MPLKKSGNNIKSAKYNLTIIFFNFQPVWSNPETRFEMYGA